MRVVKLLFLIYLCTPSALADVWNPVAFIGQFILGSTSGTTLYVDSNGLLANGLTTTTATATADTTTTSTTDVLMNSMTITPSIAGKYSANFSTCVDHSAQSVAVVVSLYVGGVQQADTVRAPVPRFNNLGAQSLNPCIPIMTNVTVNGAQAITIEWKVASGTGTAHQRTLAVVGPL